MIIKDVKEICPNTLEKISLKSLTTFKIGGVADLVCYPQDSKELYDLIQFCQKNNINFYILGAGSNILADDNGFDGIIICTKKLRKIENLGNGKILAQCGVTLTELLQFTKNNGLSGLEWSTGIPATIGGATFMNAGALGGQMSDIVESVKILKDNKEIILDKSKLFFDYRHSVFTNCKMCVIIEVLFNFSISTIDCVKQKILNNILQRSKMQNVGYPSAGSVFKKNFTLAPAFMIENCNLKGERVGDAMVSTIHSGYIVNLGKATCSQVLALIEIIKKQVKEKYNIDLELEIILLKGK